MCFPVTIVKRLINEYRQRHKAEQTIKIPAETVSRWESMTDEIVRLDTHLKSAIRCLTQVINDFETTVRITENEQRALEKRIHSVLKDINGGAS